MALSSLRVPRKLIIRGDDGKEYPVLVKTGEDLRQDERIERLFVQMNQIFSADAECRRMNVSVRTYSVTPLTTRYAGSRYSFPKMPHRQPIVDLFV